MQVAGDAVAVGLHLEPPFPLLGTGQLQDDGGLRGERGEQVEVVGGERLAAGRPQHRQHPPAGVWPIGATIPGPNVAVSSTTAAGRRADDGHVLMSSMTRGSPAS